MDGISVIRVEDDESREAAYAIRRRVFVEELCFKAEDEFDQHDRVGVCTHYLALNSNQQGESSADGPISPLQHIHQVDESEGKETKIERENCQLATSHVVLLFQPLYTLPAYWMGMMMMMLNSRHADSAEFNLPQTLRCGSKFLLEGARGKLEIIRSWLQEGCLSGEHGLPYICW